ncbi:MAG: NAD-dependent epimerase/dehydratase family protein [bacterium]|nr:NAD-dependent epimerase/dehydratase family protein [bacterium]
MKALITGGAGFIGSNCVDKFIEKGLEVAVIDNLYTGHVENIHKNATFYEIDICDPKISEIFEKEKFDYLVHFAAQMNVRHSLKDPIFDAKVNVLGSINLIENCKKFKVSKFIYISTGGAVFGEPQYLPVDENHPINPLCPYGASKHTVEHYLYMYKENYNLNYTILRYPNVYGPKQDPLGEAGVIAVFTQLMMKNKRPTIFGDGEQTRDYVYVEDVVEAAYLALTKGDGGTYNIGSGIETNVNELFRNLKRILDSNLEPIYGAPIPGEIRRISLNGSLAKKKLFWKNPLTLEEGLRKTIEYYESL